MKGFDKHKRTFLHLLASIAAGSSLPLSARVPMLVKAQARGTQNQGLLTRTIPSSGEAISAIGMGSWLTFDISPQGKAFATRVEILKTFFRHGGQMIDSSPMYGQSEEVIGQCLAALNFPQATFSATKVWTTGKGSGVRQMQESAALWGSRKFNLMQIHNLVDWKTHLDTLLQWKEKAQLDYLGITTYGGLRHGELLHIMANYPIDFVQLTYNIIDREAEENILPLAVKRNIAVIANRPFQEGRLFNYVKQKPLPEWLRQYHCENWAQAFLKFILAHPAITCAIPATSQVAHMQQNMGALKGPLPTMREREKIREYVLA